METKSVPNAGRLPILGGMTAGGLLVVLVAVGLAGFVGPAAGIETTVSHAGPPIAAVGVLISTVAIHRFG
jgi:hypothetical protein